MDYSEFKLRGQIPLAPCTPLSKARLRSLGPARPWLAALSLHQGARRPGGGFTWFCSRPPHTWCRPRAGRCRCRWWSAPSSGTAPLLLEREEGRCHQTSLPLAGTYNSTLGMLHGIVHVHTKINSWQLIAFLQTYLRYSVHCATLGAKQWSQLGPFTIKLLFYKVTLSISYRYIWLKLAGHKHCKITIRLKLQFLFLVKIFCKDNRNQCQ